MSQRVLGAVIMKLSVVVLKAMKKNTHAGTSIHQLKGHMDQKAVPSVGHGMTELKSVRSISTGTKKEVDPEFKYKLADLIKKRLAAAGIESTQAEILKIMGY